MTDKEKMYWSYFINVLGKIQYCKICMTCMHDCKQSYRIVGISCKNYKAI